MSTSFSSRVGLIAVAAAVVGSGCASASYVPQNPCVLHTVIIDGMPHYYLNGRSYTASLITGDITRATSGSPKAQALAAAAESEATMGVVMYVAGLLGMFAAPIPLVTLDSQNITTPLVAASSILLVATGVSGVGIYKMTKGMALRYDAINAYNDDATLNGRCPARALPPPGFGTRQLRVPPTEYGPVAPPQMLPGAATPANSGDSQGL